MLENTGGTIKNGQSRETDNTWHTRRIKTKRKHKTICVGNHHTQTNTNNVNTILNFGVYFHFQQYFSYMMATGFSGGGSPSTQREPPTLGKQLVRI